MDLNNLPRAERLEAISRIMEAAREAGFTGYGGECGEAAVAIRRVLFDGNAIIVAGLNDVFAERGHRVGHYAVEIADEEFERIYIDDRGVPFGDEELQSWGMLAPDDPDWAAQAQQIGLIYDDATAEGAGLYEYEQDDEVLSHMPGSGLEDKIAILNKVVRNLNFEVDEQLQIANKTRRP